MQHLVSRLYPENTTWKSKPPISQEELEAREKLQHLLALREEMEKEEQLEKRKDETPLDTAKRYVGHGVRTVVGGGADLLDIPRIPVNITRYITGQEIPESFGEQARRKFDAMTDKKYRPLTETGELADSVASGLLGMGGIGGVGKAINMTGKLAKTGKFLEQGNKYTASNIGGTAAAIAAAHELAKKNPDHPIVNILASILASGAGSIGGHVARHPVATTRSLYKRGQTGRLHAALRHQEFGQGVEEALPSYFGLGKDVAEIPYPVVGELGKKAATNLEAKKSAHFEQAYGGIHGEFNKLAADPSQRMVDVRPVVDFIAEKYFQEYAKHPRTQEIFFNGPLGRELAGVLGIPQSKLTPQMMHGLDHIPPAYTLMDVDSAFTLRKNLDGLIKSKEWLHVGADKEGLTHIRGLLDDARVLAYEKVHPELAKRLKSTNADYKHFLENDAQYINRINDKKGSHSGIYEQATADLTKEGKDLAYTLEELAPDEKATFLKRVLWDLGKHEGDVKSNLLLGRFNSLEKNVRESIFKSLPEKEANELSNLLNAQKGYKKVLREPQNVADTVIRQHAIGKESHIITQKVRKLFTKGLQNDEGKRKAIIDLIEEGKGMPSNPAANIAPLDAGVEEGVKKYIPDVVSTMVKKAVKSPGFVQQVGKAFEATKRVPLKIDITQGTLVP